MDLQTKVNRELLKFAVSHAITCPVSGKVLDVRRAVLLTVTFPSGNVSQVCMSADEWSSVEGKFREGMDAGKYSGLAVLDGRELYRRTR